MRILAFQGSPRPKGNTQALLKAVLDAAREAGAQIETVQLIGLKNLKGCLECRICQQKLDEPGCAVHDDLLPILDRSLEADLILWATPVFCWAPAWPLTIALDRFYCMFKTVDGKEVKSLLAGHKMAAVITAGGGEKDGADLVQETFRRMANFSKCQWLGALVGTYVVSPEAVAADADLTDRARSFGRQLASG
jgi:multimeric flavodoxin WrbA